MLEAEVTEEEIHKVMFSMPSNKSPGPDGFPCEFYSKLQCLKKDDKLPAHDSHKNEMDWFFRTPTYVLKQPEDN